MGKFEEAAILPSEEKRSLLPSEKKRSTSGEEVVERDSVDAKFRYRFNRLFGLLFIIIAGS
jgi:hypothetical protein